MATVAGMDALGLDWELRGTEAANKKKRGGARRGLLWVKEPFGLDNFRPASPVGVSH